jgi:serine/threonine-protein kinase
MLAEGSIVASRYRIVRRIASGGMGEVYEAVHLTTERPCAIKVMLPRVADDPVARERFQLEARVVARIESEHVVSMLDAGTDEATGMRFLVMELLRGEDLGSRLRREGPLPPAEVVGLLVQAARGLDAVHRAGVVHRDLKPSNLFLAERASEPPRLKLLDLGVAKLIGQDTTTAAVGTPHYMAPEQLRGELVSAATDVYALGMIAFTLLAGREYWADEAAQATSPLRLALATMGGPEEPATVRAARRGVTLPAAFDAWFARAAAAAPEKRFASATEAAAALGEALGIEGGQARVPTAAPAEKQKAELATAETMTLVEQATQDADRTATLGGPGITRAATGPVEAAPRASGKERRTRWLVAGLLGIASIAAAVFFLRHRAVAPVPPPPAPPVVESLACAPAALSGHQPSPELAAAIGLGACARLGVELGIEWAAPGGKSPLLVTAELLPDGAARVTLGVADRKATAEGEGPIAAVKAAVSALAPQLAAPALSAESIAAWGAREEASARRIARTVRRRAFGFAEDRAADAEALRRTDPDSPITQALVAFSLPRKSDEAWAARTEALRRLDVLPPRRAHVIEGALRTFLGRPGDEDREGRGVGLMRKAYGESMQDSDFGALYTMPGCFVIDDVEPMYERVAERFPEARISMAGCAVSAFDEPSRQARWLAGMRAVLPESVAARAGRLLELGLIEEASAAYTLAQRLGPGFLPRAELAEMRARLALAKLDPAEALAGAEDLMGDPDPGSSVEGALLRAQALLLAGRLADAEEAFRGGFVRAQLAGDAERALDQLRDELRLRRLLGREAVDKQRMEQAERALDEQRAAGQRNWSSLEAELSLARRKGRAPGKAELSAVLDKIEAEADGRWPWLRDRIRVGSLPLVRAVRGDEAALALWRSVRQVDERRAGALEAALLLEARGQRAEAEETYHLCMQRPWERPFDAMAARVRLSAMLRARGKDDEARALEVEVDRVWSGADPGLRDIVRRMK